MNRMTATITSGAYVDAFAAAPDVEVTGVACPQFVDFVERGVTSGRALLGLASGYLEPLQEAGVDTLVLGCTHYPLLAGVIGLVKGGVWGWAAPHTLAALLGGMAALALFALHAARHGTPLIDRSLFRLRPFTGAAVVALFFSAAFGAMLLSRVLWAQDVWHWSALSTGIAVLLLHDPAAAQQVLAPLARLVQQAGMPADVAVMVLADETEAPLEPAAVR